MTNVNKLFLLLFCFFLGTLVWSTSAYGQNQQHGDDLFVERPGELEFSGRMIVRSFQLDEWIQEGYTEAQARTLHQAAAARLDGWRIRYYEDVDEHIVTLPEGMDENSFSELLMATGDYQYAHPDWICYPLQTPNDPNFNNQWHHQSNIMQSELAWDIHVGDGATIAAFVDTGVDLDHPDLASQLVSGYNSVDKLPQASGGDVSDINGHGTAVGGCIGAIGDNGIGVAGCGWDLLLMPIRTSNSSGGGAFLSDILDGARWAVQNGAKTASASYTGVQNASVGTTGTDVKNDGGLFFYAADNFNQNHSGFDYADTIVVAGTDQGDNKAGFSSYGLAIDVTGPAVDVWTTQNGGGYGGSSGTSFSTPLANGVVSMIWSCNPFLTPDEAQQMLYDTVDDLGTPGEDNTFGHGRLNLYNAVMAATQGDLNLSVPATLTAGNLAALSASGATSSVVYFTYSTTGLGATPVNSLSASLGIANPVLAGSGSVSGGSASYSQTIPGNASGLDVWIQAIEDGQSSNVEFRTIQ